MIYYIFYRCFYFICLLIYYVWLLYRIEEAAALIQESELLGPGLLKIFQESLNCSTEVALGLRRPCTCSCIMPHGTCIILPQGLHFAPQGLHLPHRACIIPNRACIYPTGPALYPTGPALCFPQGLHYTPQGLHYTPQGLHYAPKGLHDALQGLHYTQQGLHYTPQGLRDTCTRAA